METDLFDWVEYDVLDVDAFSFQDITTKVQIEDIPAGTQFECATISFSTGTLTFSDASFTTVRKFKLKLAVTHEVAV
jgi:hypothetical protein